MKICVFGLWHLGCVVAACLSDLGFEVVGLDHDDKTINDLKIGKPPLFEPGLEEMIKNNLAKKTLSFTNDPKSALNDAEALWIGFDTPVDDNDVADLGFLQKNFDSVMKFIPSGAKIIISSQAPVGFTKSLEEHFAKSYPDKKVLFACSPENLRLGNALKVFKEPDRIIIGVRNPDDVKEFMPIFSKITDKIVWMKTESAEMTKHAINSFLATSIVFTNELATICEAVGANAKEVEQGLKTEARIGPKAYVGPGLSFAGGTLARDINFLIDMSKKYNKNAILINAVKQSNEYHKGWVRDKCIECFGDVKGKSFGILGLTYKANTDTLRRSASIELCEWLSENGAIVNAYDPHVKALPEQYSKRIILMDDLNEVLARSECIIIATEHLAFKQIYEDNKGLFSGKVMIDPTGFLEKSLPEKKDFKYVRIGRGS